MTALSTVDTAALPRSTLAQDAVTAAEVERLAALERRLLRVIPWIVFGGVILLAVGAGTLSWSHLSRSRRSRRATMIAAVLLSPVTAPISAANRSASGS